MNNLTEARRVQLARLHAGWQNTAAGRASLAAVGRAWQASEAGRAETTKQLERMATDPTIVLKRRVGQHLAWASMCEAKGRHARAVLHREKAEGYREALAALGLPSAG